MGLAVSLNNIFIWLLVIFVAFPLILLGWSVVGFVLSMFLGPLGYPVALLMMFYYWRH